MGGVDLAGIDMRWVFNKRCGRCEMYCVALG